VELGGAGSSDRSSLKTADSSYIIGKIINVMPSAKTMQVKHSFESLLDQSTIAKDITPQPTEITLN